MRRRLAELRHQRTPWQRLGGQPVSMPLRMPWPLALSALVLLYLSEVALFTLIFQLDPGGLQGHAPMGMLSSLAFALQNLFVASLSAIEVTSLYTFVFGTVELVVGLITTAIVTGLVVLRFLQVDAPLRFSQVLSLTGSDAGHLLCRFVTDDPSDWLNVSYGLFCFVDEEIEPGLVQRRVHSLPLLHTHTPQRHRTATLSHPLNADSPIVRLGPEGLRRGKAALMALVEGSDEVTGSPLLQVHHDGLEALRPGHVFEDLVIEDGDGRRRIDATAIDRIRPQSAST